MSKVYNIKGIELACTSSNTRYGKRNDSLVITLDEKSIINGKFTSNSFKAAPVKVALKNLSSLVPGRKALLINAGNANAATGLKGLNDVKKYSKEISTLLGISSTNVIPCSTGVIQENINLSDFNSTRIIEQQIGPR